MVLFAFRITMCSVQNPDFAATAVYKILYNALPALYCRVQILYNAVLAKSEFCTLTALQHSYNISRWSVQSRYCRDSHPDQGCSMCVQPGKKYSINLRPLLFASETCQYRVARYFSLKFRAKNCKNRHKNEIFRARFC